MEVQFGPNSVDEPNILYKLQRKIKVFSSNFTLPNRGYNLVACSSKYALVFVGVPDGTLSVYYLNQLIDKESEPQHLSVRLQEKPTHIAISCDNEFLAVTGGQILCIYKVIDFQNPNVSPSLSIKCDVNPSTFVSALQWNPCIPDSIAIAFYDGTLLACMAGSGQVKKVPANARCICWSPKGKQLVVGNSNGTLCQYKPDLTQAKVIPPPKLFEGAPVEALAVYWISTYQFAVVYKNAADNSRPAVTIVNTPKGGQPTCLNYEDICFSMGSTRPWYYYLHGLAQWNIIMSSSSNSMEIATLGSPDGANWMQWCQTDEARPELPLTDKKQENYPVGISLDTCAIHQLPWGENETLPHMPLLHVVSQSGLLTIFNVINLNKQAMQVCTPPTQLPLPAAAMTSLVLDDDPPKPVASVPTPAPVQEIKPQPSFPQVPLANQFGTASAPNIVIPSFQPSQATPPEPKPVEVKPTPVPQQVTTVQPKPQPQAVAPPKPQPVPQENAALKAEQERITKMKANQELKNMLIKEVNDFQMELYNFMVKTRETQAKIQRDIDAINSNFSFNSLDTEQLKKDCSIEDLRSAVVQLKLELVRACAVVAEARTHADAKDYNEWSQADPLTTKRVASVKKLAYYVQTQLGQAHKALDYKWNELVSREQQGNKSERRMIRPILDDVYQPLVKQQEILSRQQAVLRTLRKTLNECDVGPVFKSTTLLRSQYSKKDPLSKLTKNIFNMSIEPKSPKGKESLLTPQKLDALRDALSNHKTTKIKPVNVELRQHLANMRLNYEKSLKEKVAPAPPVAVKVEPEVKPVAPQIVVKVEPKPEPVRQPISVPSFTPVPNMKQPGLPNVARTLFTDEPKQEPRIVVPQPSLPQPQAQPPRKTISAENTRSVLKDLLQNKSQAQQAQANLAPKNDANTFMGQKICSPTAFGQQTASTPSPTIQFTAKPIADINNMFSKFQPQAFVPETKASNASSSETGEPESNDVPTFKFKLKDKSSTNVFSQKPISLAASTPNVPDVLKTTMQEKESKITIKPMEKLTEKSKENVPEKSAEKTAVTEKKEAVKPFGMQASNKSFVFGQSSNTNVTTSSSETPIDLKVESKPAELPKVVEKTEKTENVVSSSSSSSSVTAVLETKSSESPETSEKSESATSVSLSSTASKSQTSVADTEPQATKSESSTSAQTEKTPDVTPTSSASSIFSAAVASQQKTTSSIFSSPPSIFGTPPTTTAFGATIKTAFTGGSIFGTTTTTSSVFGQTTTQSSEGSTAGSIFASAVATQALPTFGLTTTTTASSIFGTATTTTAGFGTTTTTASAFAPSTTTSVFGSTSTVFGATTSTSPTIGTAPTSIFGTASVTTPAPVFGATTTPSAFAPTTSSIFGATTTASIFSTSTTQASIFGQAGPSVFGSPTTQASIFGAPTTQASVFSTPTTQASVFCASPATTQASVFGSSPATTQASVFGSPQTTQASVFGQATQASVFGTPTPSTQASVFGTPTQTTQSSVFGTPSPTKQGSVFGTPPQANPPSVFGTPTTTQSGSLFGNAENNLFAAASISTTNAPTQGTTGSIFGGSSPGSVFGGGGTNVFGGKTTFGQPNASAASIFGGSAGFGQKPAANFWAGANQSAGGFGSSAFGQQPTTQASSIFGGSTGGSFSAPSAGAFGSPQQNAFGTTEVKPSVFGSPQQQTAPAFGGSSVFGSKPVFGQTAGFGSPTSGGYGSFGGFNKSPTSGFGGPASFGGGSAFGGSAFGNTSPGKMFGNAAPGFGSPTQQSNATFENLATQNTMTFGNLAQQSGQQPQQAPSFNASPSFTEWRG